MELIISDQFLNLLKQYLSLHGLKKNDEPFGSVMDWKKKLSKVFWKFVDPKLATPETQQRFDAKTLRRLEVMKIIDTTPDANLADIKLRSLGKVYRFHYYVPYIKLDALGRHWFLQGQ